MSKFTDGLKSAISRMTVFIAAIVAANSALQAVVDKQNAKIDELAAKAAAAGNVEDEQTLLALTAEINQDVAAIQASLDSANAVLEAEKAADEAELSAVLGNDSGAVLIGVDTGAAGGDATGTAAGDGTGTADSGSGSASAEQAA